MAKFLNVALQKLKCHKLAVNPDTQEAYKISFDGPASRNLIADIYKGLVEQQADETQPWGLAASGSIFLRGLAKTFKELNATDDYEQLLKALPMLRSYAISMRAAMKMRPSKEDHDLVDKHMRLYAMHKALLWPGELTWYDTQLLYAFPTLLRKWGSLRLLCQEGMEAWQKVLNDILRLGNGFANAGAIPKDVKAKGEAEETAYMAKRDADRPNDAQWVYNQAVLRQHAEDADVLKRLATLAATPDRCVLWRSQYCVWWRRWMAAARLFAFLRKKVLRWAPGARGAPRNRDYYQALLAAHKRWWAPVELSATDLSPEVARKQAAQLRRARYQALPKAKRLLCVPPADYMA